MIAAKPSELHLHQFWEKSKYFSHLMLTQSGKKIEIIRRGSVNTDGGPDFRGIVIRLDDKIIEGDCEIHLNSADWVRHWHHVDSAYNQTCLHISLDHNPASKIILENGCEVEQLIVPQNQVLAFLARREDEIPGQKSKSCALSKQSSFVKIGILQEAGKRRLMQKSQVFSERYAAVSWDQLIYEGICQALGYAKNTQAFGKLAQLVPIDLLFHEMRQARSGAEEEAAAALLFGAAGFLETQLEEQNASPEIKRYVANLNEIWQHVRHVLQIQPMQRAHWQFFRLRPQNFPTRRIAGIAKLIVKFQRYGILERLICDVQSEVLNLREINSGLREFITIEADAFWQFHYDFKERTSQNAAAGFGMLIGKNRADDLVINILFPIIAFYAKEIGDANLGNKLLELFSCYPRLQENTVTRQMLIKILLNKSSKNETRDNARVQQGLIHLSKNLCHEEECDRCLSIYAADRNHGSGK